MENNVINLVGTQNVDKIMLGSRTYILRNKTRGIQKIIKSRNLVLKWKNRIVILIKQFLLI